MTQALLILLALILLNSLWFSPRFLFILPLQSGKNLPWCVLEVVCWYFILGGLARLAEYQTLGQVSPQHWEFYAITACLVLVFAAPGFVLRYLWK